MSNAQLSVAASSTEAHDPVFPFEIFELIANILITGSTNSGRRSRCHNRSDVASLSLVSRSFSDLSRPHLFKDVEIYMDHPLNKLQQLAIVLKANPVIASYVRHLFYYEPSFRFQEIKAERDGSLDIFLHLPAVQYLKVDGRGDQSYDIADADVAKFGFRSLLDHYISSGMLTGLFIRSISDIPIIDVMKCPNLEDLELRYCQLRGWDKPLSAEVLVKGFKLKTFETCSAHDVSLPLLAFCPRLESIKLIKMGGLSVARPEKFPILAPTLTSFDHVTCIESSGSIDWAYFCSLGDSAGVNAFPAVKYLQFEFFFPQDISHGANRIFGHLASLEELRLQVRNNLAPSLLNLEQCFDRSARTLKMVKIKWALQHGQDIEFLKTLCAALQAISNRNVIQDIHIHLEITDDRLDLSGTLFEQWARFDLLLIDNKRVNFPELKTVEINLHVSTNLQGDSTEEQQGYEDALKTSLNHLITSPEVETDHTVYFFG